MQTSGPYSSDSDSLGLVEGLVPEICFKQALPGDSVLGDYILRTLCRRMKNVV